MKSKAKKCKQPSDKQYLIFVKELESDEDFFEQHRVCNSGSLWQTVVDKMNKEVGPKKNVEEWRLALKRWKFSVRQKFRSVDPNIPGALSNFSEVQQRLLLALGQLDINSCRGCNTKSSVETKLYPLFEDMENSTTLSEKAKIYSLITNFQILRSDMLPRWICSECWNKCDDWYTFLKNCKGYVGDKYKISIDSSYNNAIETKAVKPLTRYRSKKNPKSDSKPKTNNATSKKNDDIEEILMGYDSPHISNSSISMENNNENLNEMYFSNSDPFETIFIKQESSDHFEFTDLKPPETDTNFSDHPQCYAFEIKAEEEHEDEDDETAVFDICGHDENNDSDENSKTVKNNFNQEPVIQPTKIKEGVETQKQCRRNLKCEMCDNVFWRKQTLLNHLRAHVKSAQINEEYLNRNYECFLCKIPFQNLAMLRIHMLTHAPNKNKHICLICGHAYPAAYLLKNHFKRHESSSRRTCLDCGKTFVAPENLAKHNKRYMGKPDHPSLRIDFDFKSEFIKKIDIPVVHVCKLCNKIFKSRKSLRDHGYSSHKKWEKKYLCSQCGKSFIKPNLLLTHQRTHDPTADLYPCTKCNKKFSTPPLMRAHIKTHLDHRPHVCTTCNKTFKTSSHLRTHNRVHTGARPFSCEICNMTFAYLDVLKRHKNKHADMDYYRITQ